jgi:peptidyl-prolyl cis-trans isomerase C
LARIFRSMNLLSHMAPALLGVVLAVVLAPPACAAEGSSAVLVKSAETVITRGDWEADLERVPPDKRDAFASSPQRVQAVLNSLLVSKTLAARARAQGMDRDPLVEHRIALEADRLLAAQMIDKVEGEARAEFDRNPERNLARARELYLAGGKKYAAPEEIDASHILFKTDKRGKEAALAAAQAARAKLAAGADFPALAKELSEDPTATSNGGRLSWFPRGTMDPAFELAAFGLRNPGDLSEPVLSSFGYHIIRLEGRKPARQPQFDEVKVKIIDEMRTNYVNEKRDALVGGIRSDPRLEVNKEAIDALMVKSSSPSISSEILRQVSPEPSAPK